MDKIITPIQIKICGLTNNKEAQEIASLGINAIGFVFYPKSKRYLSLDAAKEIQRNLPSRVSCVGVFVNESFSSIMKTVEHCNLDTVQLHGNETNQTILKLRKNNLNVIKALYMENEPNIKNAKIYCASSYLVECCPGKLPGGNAHSWNWSQAASYKSDVPLILAGGLTPDNIKKAVLSAMPDAVDISSGVEITPGHKDILKVKILMANLACAWEKINEHSNNKIRKVFYE